MNTDSRAVEPYKGLRGRLCKAAHWSTSHHATKHQAVTWYLHEFFHHETLTDKKWCCFRIMSGLGRGEMSRWRDLTSLNTQSVMERVMMRDNSTRESAERHER